MNKNVTLLLSKSMPWICISFLWNLVAFSPIYFVFPVVKKVLSEHLQIQQRVFEIFYPLRNVPIVSTLAEKSEQIAEFVLLAGWLYVSIALSIVLLNLIRSYITYFLKAGHISVVSALIRNVAVKNQLTYGLKEVGRRFGSVNLMFAGDLLTRKVVLGVNSLLFRDDSKVPAKIRENRFFSAYLKGLVRTVLIHLDEVLLSYVMANKGNVWKLYCKGIAKYLKSWRGVIVDSIKTVFLISILSGLVQIFIYALVFVSMRGYDVYTIVIALALARYLTFCVKATFLEAYEYIRMLVVFYTTVEKEEAEEAVLNSVKEYVPSLKSLMKKGGIKETVEKVSSGIHQGIDLDGVGLDELLKMNESKLVPDDLEPGNYLKKIKTFFRKGKVKEDDSVQP